MQHLLGALLIELFGDVYVGSVVEVVHKFLAGEESFLCADVLHDVHRVDRPPGEGCGRVMPEGDGSGKGAGK